MMHDVLFQKMSFIRYCLKRIEETIGDDLPLLSNHDTQDVVVFNLQRAIQASIDMAAYLLAEKKLGLASSLRDTFLILEQNNIISHDTGSKMQKMVGFRNIAVHAYQ